SSFFFFSSRRRHTRFSRDWSSDVCSSDLATWNRAFSRELAAAFARARATRPASPSMPTTCFTRRAMGRVKLPRPQNRSRTTESRSEERRVGKEGRARREEYGRNKQMEKKT